MNRWIGKLAVPCLAILSTFSVPGCSNNANESGAGAAPVGGAAVNAPNSQEEFFKQQQEKIAQEKAAKARKSGRPAK